VRIDVRRVEPVFAGHPVWAADSSSFACESAISVGLGREAGIVEGQPLVSIVEGIISPSNSIASPAS